MQKSDISLLIITRSEDYSAHYDSMKDGAFKLILPYLLRKRLRRMAGR